MLSFLLANVALNYAAAPGSSIKAVVLLSPRLNYKGVTTSDATRQYKGPIYIAWESKNNEGYCYS